MLDLKDPPVKVASHQTADLRDPDAVAAAIDKIGGKIDALFNAAGLPGAAVPRRRHDAGELRRAAAPHRAASCRT